MKPRNFFHKSWMRQALSLAEKGKFAASPNPMVGACVVKNGRLVGKGYHHIYGGNHAEVEALRKAGRRARGATLYVTLEPCATWGKTPPCAAAILKAGIREVVIGALDPNLKNRSKGIAALRKARIKVKSGILRQEVEKQNQSFFKWTTKRLPFVTLKMAQSLDGKIATREGHSRWISSKPAREFVHRLRAEQDAILIGTNTLRKDDPLLSPGGPFPAGTGLFGDLSRNGNGPFRRPYLVPRSGKPWRVVLDPKFKISARARIFRGPQLTLVAVSERIAKARNFGKRKTPSCAVLPVKEKKGRLDLLDLLRKLASLGVAKLLVEGGGELAWSLIEERFVDQFYWIVAPKFIGGRAAKTSLEGEGVRRASEALPCRITGIQRLGEDLLIKGSVL